jgi:hydrogenase maturation protein HypF
LLTPPGQLDPSSSGAAGNGLTTERQNAVARQRIRVTGTVQGVGFRPFVYREARSLDLAGFVLNDSKGVLIEAEGDLGALAELCRVLIERPPPLALVTGVETRAVPAKGSEGTFVIVESSSGGAPAAPVSVDSATCGDCLNEVDDPADRRHQYPFTNCTNCGPRYTIVLSVPYDRPATTMSEFVMCPECQAEYDDPADRRFHAQPNSCPACGPQISYYEPDGTVVGTSATALSHAVEKLTAGQVLAVKGIGGYHLAADAGSADAVATLRRRKARDDKPFALMVRDLSAARRLVDLDETAAAAISSIRRPIVLARRRASAANNTQVVAEGVAPGLPEYGVMLPYTPLHHLLLSRLDRPLVMTSGNFSDEPIAHIDEDAFERLGPLVDGVLTHDRPIHIRCDDSVLRSAGGKMQIIRRSRGYAPEPLALGRLALRQVLAVGAELKNTVSVVKGGEIITSHHIGDLEHLASYASFLQATVHLCGLFGVEPEVVVHDLHPEYLSTKYAQELDVETWAVQHHHAHVASCLAEHRRTDTVIGVAFDGLGFGLDGDMWGGEFLIADLEGFERAGHLRRVPMAGGSAAIREPWRMALSWVAAAAGTGAAARLGATLDDRWPAVLSLIEPGLGLDATSGGAARSSRIPVLHTTSAGRLFDAAAAILGVRSRVSYEGQGAIELEALAVSVPDATAPHYPIEVTQSSPLGPLVLDPAPLITSLQAEMKAGRPATLIAAGFHRAIADGVVTVVSRLATQHQLHTVVLTGGVFQNVRLTRLVKAGLDAIDLEVLLHSEVPPNDGGISVGQAAIGATAARSPLV